MSTTQRKGEDFERAKQAPFVTVLRLLDKDFEQLPNGVKFQCPNPSHDDRNPSADTTGSNGKAYLCRSCGDSGTVIDIVAKSKNLSPIESAKWINSNYHNDIDTPPAKRKPKGRGFNSLEDVAQFYQHKNNGQPVTIHKYDDTKGVIRYIKADGGKSFCQCHRDNNGLWQLNEGPEKWPLYGTDNLTIGHPEPFIIIVEGEKCANSINETRGQFYAVTSRGGKDGARKTDWTTLPAGYPLIIWRDNDEPGKAYENSVIEQIKQAGHWPEAGITVINPPAHWPVKHDAADELEGMKATEAIARIEEVIRQYGRTVGNPEEAIKEANTTRLSELGLKPAIGIERQDVDWLIPGIMAKGELTLIVGEAGSGKTKVAFSRAAHLSTGQPLAGMEIIGGPQKCAIISLEEDAGRTIRPVLEFSGADLNKFIIYTPEENEKGINNLNDLCNAIEALAKAGYSYILLDSLTAFYARFGLDIISSGDPYIFSPAINKVARQHNVSVELIHHYSKGGAAHGNHHKTAGSFAVTSSVRNVQQVEHDKTTGTRFLGVAPNKNNLGLRHDMVLTFRIQKTREDLNSGQGYAIAELGGWNTSETIDDISARIVKSQYDHLRAQIKPIYTEAAEAITNYINLRDGVAKIKDIEKHLYTLKYSANSIREAKKAAGIEIFRDPRDKLKGEYFATNLSTSEAQKMIIENEPATTDQDQHSADEK
jgi:RecA/RadA recombinase